ncbi:hypothetical protein H632_c4721p0, partial [Helicosporidium sp. ATCC 50920]
EWNEALQCVDRIWEELSLSLAFIGHRAGAPPPPQLSSPPGSQRSAAKAGPLVGASNPFLCELSAWVPSPDLRAAALEPGTAEDLSAVETRLRDRIRRTLESATEVLRRVEEVLAGGGEGDEEEARRAEKRQCIHPSRSAPALGTGSRGMDVEGDGEGAEKEEANPLLQETSLT